MNDELFTTIPEGWTSAPAPVTNEAMRAVRECLADDQAVEDLLRYYDPIGNYAGASFLEVGPSSPWDLEASDLLALTLLSVQAPPSAVRKLLEASPERNEVLRLLAEPRLPMDADLAMAGDQTLAAMADLHEAFKLHLSSPDSASKNPWVTASKLCARKRPDLFPVRDRVVCSMLGIGKNYHVDWQVFRHIMQADDVRKQIDGLVDAASERGARIGRPTNRLRHLDALLWMRGARRSSKTTTSDAVTATP